MTLQPEMPKVPLAADDVVIQGVTLTGPLEQIRQVGPPPVRP
jgi:hypothetical protein